MTFLKHLFMEADNKTWDLGRILWALGVLVFFGLAIMAYGLRDMPQEFDPLAFGGGLAAVLAAGGGMIWMKDREGVPPDAGP